MTVQLVKNALGRNVPFAQLLGIKVESVDRRQATTRVFAHSPLTNHTEMLHGGVIFTLCETASHAAVVHMLGERVSTTRFSLKEGHVEYLKPVTGEVKAKAQFTDDVDAVIEALLRDGRVVISIDVNAVGSDLNGAEVPVAWASFYWHLRMRRE